MLWIYFVDLFLSIGLMGYAIFRELMSSKSPNGVYSAALKLCKKDVRVWNGRFFETVDSNFRVDKTPVFDPVGEIDSWRAY
jgi:TIM21